MTLVSEIKAIATAGIAKYCRAINEKYRVISVVFLVLFGEEWVSDNVLAVSSSVCGNSFVSGLTAAYS